MIREKQITPVSSSARSKSEIEHTITQVIQLQLLVCHATAAEKLRAQVREQTATGVETEQKMDLKAVTTAATTVMHIPQQVTARPIAADWDRAAETEQFSQMKLVNKVVVIHPRQIAGAMIAGLIKNIGMLSTHAILPAQDIITQTRSMSANKS